MKRDSVYGMGAQTRFGQKKSITNAFLLFAIILFDLLHMIGGIACACASTHTTGLMRVKNSMCHFYL